MGLFKEHRSLQEKAVVCGYRDYCLLNASALLGRGISLPDLGLPHAQVLGVDGDGLTLCVGVDGDSRPVTQRVTYRQMALGLSR